MVVLECVGVSFLGCFVGGGVLGELFGFLVVDEGDGGDDGLDGDGGEVGGVEEGGVGSCEGVEVCLGDAEDG